MRVLIEMAVDERNGVDIEVAEWEEIECMVDSGAGTTAIGPGYVKAVMAGETDLNRNYKLADGIIIHNKGHKGF